MRVSEPLTGVSYQQLGGEGWHVRGPDVGWSREVRTSWGPAPHWWLSQPICWFSSEVLTLVQRINPGCRASVGAGCDARSCWWGAQGLCSGEGMGGMCVYCSLQVVVWQSWDLNAGWQAPWSTLCLCLKIQFISRLEKNLVPPCPRTTCDIDTVCCGVPVLSPWAVPFLLWWSRYPEPFTSPCFCPWLHYGWCGSRYSDYILLSDLPGW